MTSFNTGDPGAGGTSKEGTSFQAPGAAANGGTPEDTTVVFEHGGRTFTKADLAKKLDSADMFIEQLKSEGAENRKALDAATAALKEQINAVDILKQIKQQGAPTQGAPGTEQPQAQPLTVDEVVKQIEARTAQATTEAQRKANFSECAQTLTKAFGAAVDEKVAQIRAEKGLTPEQAVEMARATPKAFLALFPDLSKQPGPSPLPRQGTVNTQAFNQTRERGSSGYTKARQTNELVSIYQQRLNEIAGA